MDTTAQTKTQSPLDSVLDDAALAADPSDSTQMGTESLEDQNIFVLLGVVDGTDQEKESFLDELQQVIWEDFLENDVKVLLTTDELSEMQKLLDKQYPSELEKQEVTVEYLEKLIPDLEEIMLEKALELKADLFRERITGMNEFYASDSDKLGKLTEVSNLVQQDKWSSAASLLNSL